MKILTFKRFVGLAAIGGVAYVHKQRGGEWTIASVADTLRYLWSTAIGDRGSAMDNGRETLARAASVVDPTIRKGMTDDRTVGTYGHTGRNDDTDHH